MITTINLTADLGDGWLCDTDSGDAAYLYASMANDYPDATTLLAALVPNRDPHGPKWFVAGVLPSDTPVTPLDGIHEGWSAYLDLMSKARMCRKIIDLSYRSKVWYVGMDVDYYLETYDD